MNYLLTAAVLSFCAGPHLNMNVVEQASGLKGRIHRYMDAIGFANEVDRLLNLYRPEITRSQLNLIDSHDMPRFLSCASSDENSLKLAWLCIFTMPGAPCIYYGDEIGLEGGHDPDCRRSFPWDESKWDKNLLSYAREVVALRKQSPALRRGDYRRLFAADSAFCYSRTHEAQTFIVALNASESPQQIEVTYEAKTDPKVVFGEASDISAKDARLKFRIPARSGIVLK
jgi:cyclomaltodextrinase